MRIAVTFAARDGSSEPPSGQKMSTVLWCEFEKAEDRGTLVMWLRGRIEIVSSEPILLLEAGLHLTLANRPDRPCPCLLSTTKFHRRRRMARVLQQPVRSRSTFGIWQIPGTFVFLHNPAGLSNLSIRQKSKKIPSLTYTTSTNSLPAAPQQLLRD
jgi:hypothetical protein